MITTEHTEIYRFEPSTILAQLIRDIGNIAFNNRPREIRVKAGVYSQLLYDIKDDSFFSDKVPPLSLYAGIPVTVFGVQIHAERP